MPVSVVGAGKVPEATLRGLPAAIHAIEFVAQPGQIRVPSWMAKRSAWCWLSAGLKRPWPCSARRLSHTSVRAPRAAHQEATQLCLATRATVLRADWWRVKRGTMAELHHVQTSVRVSVIGDTQAQR